MNNHTTPPDVLPIKPLEQPPNCRVQVPGSKSITNRALILAALADTSPTHTASILTGALKSEDTEVMIAGLQQLGIAVTSDWTTNTITVPATGGKLPVADADLFVANSGTTMRFLTAFVSLGQGRYRLDGIARMRQRPIADLLTALCQLGVNAVSENRDGCPPVIVATKGLPGGHVGIKGDVSSQFLSALLMAAPLAQNDITVDVDGALVSWPYVAMTIEVMMQFGVDVEVIHQRRFVIPSRWRYTARTFAIEPDASAASYFAGAAAITGGSVTLPGLSKTSLQGDVGFIDVLGQMGCKVEYGDAAVCVRGGTLRGIDVDMNAISDTVMTLAVVACFAEGPTTIRNVEHIRHKETDRLTALAAELGKLGVHVEETASSLTITPQPMHGAGIDTYNDHRMAMSFALVGLRVPGVVIRDPGCVGKTYPEFFKDLEQLRC